MLKRTITITLACVLAGSLSAQRYSLRMGNKAYDGLAYSDAIAYYEEAAQHGADTMEFAARMAESYYNLRDFHNAAKWYAAVCAGPKSRTADLYHYAQCLRSNGDYPGADAWMDKYRAANTVDQRAQEQAGSVSNAPALSQRPIRGCNLRNLKENCTHADMCATYWGTDKVVFASSRAPEAARRNRHAWNGDPFLDLYIGRSGADGELTGVERLNGLNTHYHESNAVLARNGEEVWFTRNNFSSGKKGKSTDDIVKLKIYSRILSGGKWMIERPFPFNGDEHSTGHPCFSADGNTMYFTSDMPGGHGGADIWMSKRKSASEWEAPVNLGPDINTAGDEMFPFIDKDGVLYFSSDGHAGLGGLDVFTSGPRGSGFAAPSNAGVPINSRSDDFGLVLAPGGLNGYLTSDRSGGMGGDDLYAFTLEAPLAARIALRGVLRDLRTGEPLPAQSFMLRNITTGQVEQLVTNAMGFYELALDEQSAYELVVDDPRFRRTTKSFTTAALTDTVLIGDLDLGSPKDVSLWYNVKNAFTGEPLSEVKISRLDERALDQIEKAALFATDKKGDFREQIEGVAIGDSIVYYIVLEKEGYYPKKGYFRYKVTEYGEIDLHRAMSNTKGIDLCMFPLDPVEMKLVCEHNNDRSSLPLEPGRDLRDMMDIKPILFDLNKSDIRPDAARELDKIVGVMKTYPRMHIELGSHTDSRGSSASNAALSDRRAKSSAAYIVSHGIGRERISGKGYGEMHLENRCGDGVKCTEAEHQMNRRTEFVIVKL